MFFHVTNENLAQLSRITALLGKHRHFKRIFAPIIVYHKGKSDTCCTTYLNALNTISVIQDPIKALLMSALSKQ